MNEAEIAVLRARMTTLQFINSNLSCENEKLRIALTTLLDSTPPEIRLEYYPSVELAKAALNRM